MPSLLVSYRAGNGCGGAALEAKDGWDGTLETKRRMSMILLPSPASDMSNSRVHDHQLSTLCLSCATLATWFSSIVMLESHPASKSEDCVRIDFVVRQQMQSELTFYTALS